MSLVCLVSSLSLAKINSSRERSIFIPGTCLIWLDSLYLETLCDILYDDLRPRILHEPRLTVLCDVCTVLQALMVLDATSTSDSTASSTVVSSDDEDEDDQEEADFSSVDKIQGLGLQPRSQADEASASSLGKNRKIERRLHIGHLLRMVLQDAQTRLFFKAQAVVQGEIRHYVPTPGDLKWPDILLGSYSMLIGDRFNTLLFNSRDGVN